MSRRKACSEMRHSMHPNLLQHSTDLLPASFKYLQATGGTGGKDRQPLPLLPIPILLPPQPDQAPPAQPMGAAPAGGAAVAATEVAAEAAAPAVAAAPGQQVPPSPQRGPSIEQLGASLQQLLMGHAPEGEQSSP